MKNVHNIIIIIICILLAITLLLIIDKENNELIHSYIGIIFSILIFTISIQKRKTIKIPLLIAFLCRMGMCIMYSFFGDADPDGYANVAQNYMNMDILELFNNIPIGAYFYSWIISIIWRFIGSSMAIVRIINMIISYYCCIIAYEISKEIYRDKKIQNKIVWIISIFPSLIRFSAPFASRETFFIFALLMCILCLTKYYYRKKIKYFIYSLFFFVIGIILHTAMLTFGLLYVLIIANKYKNQDKINKFLKTGFLMVILFGFAFILLKNNIGTEKLNIGGGGVSLEKVGWLQESSAAGRAAYLTNLNFSNPILIVLMLPIRSIYFLYTPFIWMVRNILDILGIIDATIYIYLTYCIWKNYKMIKTENKFNKYLLLATLATIIFMAAVTSNYGTALRHRAKIVIPIIIIAAPFAFKKKDKRGEK